MSANNYSEDLDSIDASVFSGELLIYNLEEFKEYVERWSRAIQEHEKFLKDFT